MYLCHVMSCHVMYVCMYMYVGRYVYMHVCMYACTHASQYKYVGMYVDMYGAALLPPPHPCYPPAAAPCGSVLPPVLVYPSPGPLCLWVGCVAPFAVLLVLC